MNNNEDRLYRVLKWGPMTPDRAREISNSILYRTKSKTSRTIQDVLKLYCYASEEELCKDLFTVATNEVGELTPTSVFYVCGKFHNTQWYQDRLKQIEGKGTFKELFHKAHDTMLISIKRRPVL